MWFLPSGRSAEIPTNTHVSVQQDYPAAKFHALRSSTGEAGEVSAVKSKRSDRAPELSTQPWVPAVTCPQTHAQTHNGKYSKPYFKGMARLN